MFRTYPFRRSGVRPGVRSVRINLRVLPCVQPPTLTRVSSRTRARLEIRLQSRELWHVVPQEEVVRPWQPRELVEGHDLEVAGETHQPVAAFWVDPGSVAARGHAPADEDRLAFLTLRRCVDLWLYDWLMTFHCLVDLFRDGDLVEEVVQILVHRLIYTSNFGHLSKAGTIEGSNSAFLLQ